MAYQEVMCRGDRAMRPRKGHIVGPHGLPGRTAGRWRRAPPGRVLPRQRQERSTHARAPSSSKYAWDEGSRHGVRPALSGSVVGFWLVRTANPRVWAWLDAGWATSGGERSSTTSRLRGGSPGAW
jgi:hypothetical protein